MKSIMVRRSEVFGISIVAIVCLVLIGFSQKDISNYQRSHRNQQFIEIDDSFKYTNNYTETSIDDVILLEREFLLKELSKYEFPEETSVDDYTLSTGGRPIRTVIITTWRSGSTFLGDILNALPGNYYHYEPLLDYGIVQIRGPPLARTALESVKSLLSCDYSNLYNYLNFGMSHVYLFTHNTRLWDQCELHPSYCWNATFLNKFCKLFPFQSMKSVRLRLALAEELLQDDELNVKVILLVRDPRGTMQSRKHRDWCPGRPDCDQPSNLCRDLVSDHKAAVSLVQLYPDRFRAVRYEDFSLDPTMMTRDLFDFLGLNFHRNVEKFLSTHTRFNIGGVSSTFRDSKSTPFHWKADLNSTEIQNIEESCEEAMKLWGYIRAKNVTDMKEFNPLTAYRI